MLIFRLLRAGLLVASAACVYWTVYLLRLHVLFEFTYPTRTPLGVLKPYSHPHHLQSSDSDSYHYPLSSPLDFSNASAFVALTSIPSRVARLGPTIQSLLRQSVFAPVVVYLPRVSRLQGEAGYPDPLPAYLNVPPYVQVRWVERDYGPATKFIPAFLDLLTASTHPRPPAVIVVDDDVIYGAELVRGLWEAHQRLPGAALCYRGWKVPTTLDWLDGPTMFASEVTTPTRVGVITATHGYLLPTTIPSSSSSSSLVPLFSSVRELLDELAQTPEEATFMDDVWLSGQLSRRHVPKFLIPLPILRTSEGSGVSGGVSGGSMPNLLSFATRDLGYRRRERNNAALWHYRGDWAPEEMINVTTTATTKPPRLSLLYPT